MGTLINEIMEALKNRLLYAALLLALTLPDICAALESQDGRSTPGRYKAWFNTWLRKKYEGQLDAQDMYRLRCAVAHQGRFEHPGMKYERVFFTLRPNGMFFHKNELPGIRKDGLNLDIVFFCKDVVESVEAWFAQKEGDPQVQENLTRLVQFHPKGLSPYLEGVPAIG